MNYDNQPILVEIGDQVLEICNFPTGENEKAAQLLKDTFGDTILETLYNSAKEQRHQRLENEHYKWGEPNEKKHA